MLDVDTGQATGRTAGVQHDRGDTPVGVGNQQESHLSSPGQSGGEWVSNSGRQTLPCSTTARLVLVGCHGNRRSLVTPPGRAHLGHFFWFSRSRLPPNKLIAGCVTDDELVRAVITNGKYAGVAVGLVGVRSEGAFGVTIGNGVNPDVHWRYCTNFQRIDGWEWSRHGDEAVNVA